jgi:hypothetical protein
MNLNQPSDCLPIRATLFSNGTHGALNGLTTAQESVVRGYLYPLPSKGGQPIRPQVRYPRPIPADYYPGVTLAM